MWTVCHAHAYAIEGRLQETDGSRTQHSGEAQARQASIHDALAISRVDPFSPGWSNGGGSRLTPQLDDELSLFPSAAVSTYSVALFGFRSSRFPVQRSEHGLETPVVTWPKALRKQQQQQQQLLLWGTTRSYPRGDTLQKHDTTPPGGTNQPTSGYIPNPAIPPYPIRILHFVEYRLRSQIMWVMRGYRK